MRTLYLAAACAAALTLTACSGTTSDSAAEPTPTGPPERGIAVNSINELRDAVEAAGVQCDDYYLRDLAGASGVEDFANCNESLTFGTFDSQTAAESWAQSLDAMTGGDATMLVGDKWAMNVGDENADQLQSALGGTTL